MKYRVTMVVDTEAPIPSEKALSEAIEEKLDAPFLSGKREGQMITVLHCNVQGVSEE